MDTAYYFLTTLLGFFLGYFLKYYLHEKENILVNKKIATMEADCNHATNKANEYKTERDNYLQESITKKEELVRVQQELKNNLEFQQSISTTQKHSFDEIIQKSIKTIENNVKSLMEPVDNHLKEHSQSQGVLKETMSNLQNHISAFTKNFKVLGDWGEQTLCNVLTAHGLVEGVDYQMQNVNIDSETNQRPDCIIKHEKEAVLIIDVKTSLDNYRSYINSENKDDAKRYLNDFVVNIRKHINDLSKKDYQSSYNSASSSVVMYIPMEGALISALNHDSSLYQYGMDKKVLLTSNSILFILLNSLNQVKKKDAYNKNAEEISKEAGKLLGKFQVLLKQIESIHNAFKKAEGLFYKSVRSITGSNTEGDIKGSSIIGVIKKINELGGNQKKDLKDAEVKINKIGYTTIDIQETDLKSLETEVTTND